MRTLLITGANSDIGLGIINRIANDFDKIIVHYFGDDQALLYLKEQYPQKITVLEGDFSSEEKTEVFVNKVISPDIEITDFIHLPAGTFKNIKFGKLTWSDFSRELEIGLRSLVLITNKLIPEMSKRKNGNIIVMLSSCTTNIPPKYISNYVTAKYALLGLVKALSTEYADKGIRVNGISPTMIETKFLKEVPELLVQQNAANSPTGNNLQVSEVIPLFEFLLSDGSKAITGQNISITNGNLM